jgi:MerR family transcriptional regulator, redox-sensitive transcriptional activator SoxR
MHFCATDDFTASASNGVLQSMDIPNRSRANHAVRYVCPEWTWPADELIHIREMSERTSVPASSLRYYEKLGLITSERETSGSQRRYSKSTFYKIILITLAQSAGFNLDEIAEQLRNLPDIHPLPPKVWGPLHKIWERRIDQRVAELKQLKINLRRCTRDASR